ncbi:uncharacterized protein LOC106878030 [Octopus bimaculoides]|uniref:Protein kinase domain-containing protein n=1 Tax=Octopus bimaculoides TaxID=37653 RepID=A0A0L8GBF3_OCTBM|nr:uncharacterized protein LOC106878030 [Octopus bimaculoides]|eukprot:XP_014782602.1 PREDICTED: uncharacterized protein LOC106878030 [Octopus bimaculoides]
MPFNNKKFQRQVSEIFIHISGKGHQQLNTEKSSLTSCSSEIKETKIFGHYTKNKIKRPRCLLRLSLVPFKQMTKENIEIRQLVQRGFVLIMSICQLKYADTFQTESWYFLNGSVLYCSLYICLHKIDAIFPETDVFIFLRRIYYALEYIHQNGFIHGNITSHAIQIMDTYSVKLSYFEYVHVKEKAVKWTTGDSWRWMSPETLLRKQSSLKSDVFSFCCVCLEYFSNCLPWDKRSQLFVKKHYINGNSFPQEKFSVPTEIKECFSNGLATKKHQRKFNIHQLETVMKSRANRTFEANMNNVQIKLNYPNVLKSRYSNQVELTRQQLKLMKTPSKSIHTKNFAILNRKSCDGNTSNNSNKTGFNRIQTDSVKFLIKYFENRSIPNTNSTYFNSKNLRRRTLSSCNHSATMNSPENLQVSKATLIMESPSDNVYISNRTNQKTPSQNLTSLEELQTPKNTLPGILNAKISHSDIVDQAIRINNLVYLRRQSCVSQKLTFKNSSPENSLFSEYSATDCNFVTASTEHFDIERGFLGNQMSTDSSIRRKSFPIYSSTSKTHYPRLNQDYNRNLNFKFSHSFAKISPEQRPETSKIQKTETNQKTCAVKNYVKSQVNRWESSPREHSIKSQGINLKSNFNYARDKDIHLKIDGWENKTKI